MQRQEPLQPFTDTTRYVVQKTGSASEQVRLIERAQKETITAEAMEKFAAERAESLRGRRRRGAPVSHHRFSTSQALVSVTFRKKDVTATDILEALNEARLQASPKRQTNH